MDELFERLPVIALRGLTVFPGAAAHFDLGREKSVKAMDRAMSTNQRVFLLTQRDVLTEEPGFDDLYEVGTVAKIRQILRLPGESVRLLVEGESRAVVDTVLKTNPYLCCRVMRMPEPECGKLTPKIEAEIRLAYRQFEEFMDLAQRPAADDFLKLLASKDPGYIADLIAQNATFEYDKKMTVLMETNPVRRLHILNALMQTELEVLRLENEMQDKAQDRMNKGQRDYFLHEQLKAIYSELGEDDEDDFDAYAEKIRGLKLQQDTEEKLLKEVSKLRKQASGSAEASVIRNYLDLVFELPWNEQTKERLDISAARKILDEDHYGLQKVKQRIIEFLAVKKLAPENRGQILCLVGPPGVGKTSVAMSIARCLNRKLARISLGGVHDEAEIRGHRRTYIGAMPGRVITALSQVKSRNPLILFDEIDKLGSDYRGDPSAALLEVLDAEQNNSFRDNYLEVPFDLSGCMFITTANTTDTIPRALLDRMEVIELNSYTDEEKLMIAKQHLVPKQLKIHGIRKTQLRFTDDAIRLIVSGYTRESGVRNLEREIAGVCRKAAILLVAEDAPKTLRVTPSNLETYLGIRKFIPDYRNTENPVGIVNGLAWTSVGGEILEVECSVMDGSGKTELTGNLGDVMKESVHAAITFIRSNAAAFHIAEDFYKTKDIHVHFPEGAVPKDGPSAGVTVCTAIVSALSGAAVRSDIAMTGEISIRGRVLPIGGLKEKTMAALRHGIKTVIIPKENEKDLEEIDQTVRQALSFITVSRAEQVLQAALIYPVADAEVVSSSASELETGPLAVHTPAKRERKPNIRQ